MTTPRRRTTERMGFLRALDWLVARTLFPVVLLGCVAYSMNAIESGIRPATAIGLSTIVPYFVIGLLERVFFSRDRWLHSKGDVHVDVGHLLVSGLLTTQLLEVPIRLGAIAVATWLASIVGGSLWPSDLNLWLQLALALVVGEFFMYWVHRLAHERDFLWRFHAVHHSAPRLYFFNAVRFHPIDLAISTFAPMIPLLLLGADARIIALFGLVSAVHGLFQHANLVYALGPLNWIFSMAELHRWHHSTRLEEANRNYGQNLIIWDIVFGTRYLPTDREPPEEIGLSAGLEKFPMDYWGQLMSPFRWRAIKEASAADLM